MSYSIDALNRMSQESFVEVLGAVFEATPTIAQRAWNDRPFADVTELHQTMVSIMTAMSQPEQLALIRSHPDLGSRTQMATASVQEQTGAGLMQLSPEDHQRFQMLNQAYEEKFGFPFIIAVKNHSRTSILAAFDRRLQHNRETEVAQALTEIGLIAQFRLLDLVERS